MSNSSLLHFTKLMEGPESMPKVLKCKIDNDSSQPICHSDESLYLWFESLSEEEETPEKLGQQKGEEGTVLKASFSVVLTLIKMLSVLIHGHAHKGW